MATLIETHDLSKHFEQTIAVEGVTLQIDSGEILALLGPNGAGKTTTIRMLASILTPSRGGATIAGFDVVRQARQARRNIGLLTEHHGLYTRMCAREYLLFFGRAYGLSDGDTQARVEDLLERHGLGADADRRLGEFSKGMRQKLALVRALLHKPAVLLLDEPTSAMDPASARQVRQQIKQLRSANRAIVVCTHNLQEAEDLADRVAIIAKGEIVALGTVAELKRSHLGPPIMELRLQGYSDGLLQLLPGDISPVGAGEGWVRYRTADPEKDNPRVIRAITSEGFSVVTLSEVGRSLEEVYLNVVGAQCMAEGEFGG